MDKKGMVSVLAVLLAGIGRLVAADLALESGDLRVDQGVDGGYHLYVRQKPGIESVLLTESTRDPTLKTDNYAYRSPEWNAVNGDEIRLLDGVPIPKQSAVWSLIDSTPENDAQFTRVFHIYIPYIINYGYAWSRNGEVYVVDGTYLNIRAFAQPFADYRGAFKDNPFVLRVTQKPLPGPPEGNFMADTVEAFTEIAAAGKGEVVWSTGADDVVPQIKTILEDAKGKTVDLVLALDTTSSMQDDIDSVRRLLIPMLTDIIKEFSSFRIGMTLYKDYFEEYLNKIVPFTDNFASFQANLNAIRVSGGRDIPEAVFEALHESAVKFSWNADERIIILIGDAPPHPRQRGEITKKIVDEAVAARDLKVNVIILPQ